MGAYSDLKRYLDREGLYYEEDVLNDGEKYLRLQQEIDNGEPLSIIFSFSDEEDQINIYVLNIAKITDSSKRGELYNILNKMNDEYNYWKFVASNNGEVSAKYNIKVGYGTDYDTVLFPVRALVFLIIEKDLRKPLMRLQWA